MKDIIYKPMIMIMKMIIIIIIIIIIIMIIILMMLRENAELALLIVQNANTMIM